MKLNKCVLSYNIDNLEKEKYSITSYQNDLNEKCEKRNAPKQPDEKKTKNKTSYNLFVSKETNRLKNETKMSGSERRKEISRLWSLYKANKNNVN